MAFTQHPTGANNMMSGQSVLYLPDQRVCRVDEFTSDGDAFVTYPDGTYDLVRWRHLAPLQDQERAA